MQRVHSGALWLAQSLEQRGGLGYGAAHDLAYLARRPVGGARGAAIGDELVEVEHGLIVAILSRFKSTGLGKFRTTIAPILRLVSLPSRAALRK
jgi:hypothetical protein